MLRRRQPLTALDSRPPAVSAGSVVLVGRARPERSEGTPALPSEPPIAKTRRFSELRLKPQRRAQQSYLVCFQQFTRGKSAVFERTHVLRGFSGRRVTHLPGNADQVLFSVQARTPGTRAEMSFVISGKRDHTLARAQKNPAGGSALAIGCRGSRLTIHAHEPFHDDWVGVR